MVTLRRPVVATVTALVLALPVAVPAVASGHTADNVPDHNEQRIRLDELNESIRHYAEELLHEHAHAVDGALLALKQSEADLAAATEAAEAARAEATAAQADVTAAEHELGRVRRDQQRTTRQLATLTTRIAALRDQIGAAARSTSQSGGAMLGRGTLYAAGGALRDLTESQAALADARERLRHLGTERQRLAAAVNDAVAQAEAAEPAAREAEQRLEESRAAHAEALAEAEAARDEEHQRYEEFLAESEALEEWLAEYGLDETIEGTGTFSRPGTGRVTSPFGPRMHPILGYVKTHTGIDLGIGDGFIYAADHGVVVEAKWNDAYGYMVVIDHGVIDGRQVSTLYAHQPGLSVDVGMPVAKGQPIGSIGSTGYSTGPHLHFEVRVGGAPVDPWPLIRSAPMPEPME